MYPEEETFSSLGVNEELCKACERVGWYYPTAIQREAIPIALEGNDVIGLAETGSGKTGAFALPILQAWLEDPKRSRGFALILTPTWELAFQITKQFEVLGKVLRKVLGGKFGLKFNAIVGGTRMDRPERKFTNSPHIIIGTPGRLLDHMEGKKIRLNNLKFLVMDEADQILNLRFKRVVDKIVKQLPKNRRTLLFSATMTSKVDKLQRAHLKDPVRVEVSSQYQTVKKLQQKMLFIPDADKSVYLYYILRKIGAESIIVFCETCQSTLNIALMLRALKLSAIPIHSKMSQAKRNKAIEKFKSQQRSILVGTNVIARGLDIPNVDYVINFNLPKESKNYIHRVGRTARAGKAGTAITIVTQYEVKTSQKLEDVLGLKLVPYNVDENEVMSLKEMVVAAEKESKEEAKQHVNDFNKKGKKKKRMSDEDDDDTEQILEKRKKLKKKR